MKGIFKFKVVAREGKLQLCVWMKGKSASSRFYRVINIDEMPGLEFLGPDGYFTGKSKLVKEANKRLDAIYAQAESIATIDTLCSAKDFVAVWDEQNDQQNLTIGQFVGQLENDFHFCSSGNKKSWTWKHYKTLRNKLEHLKMDGIRLKDFGNAEYQNFCDRMRRGDGISMASNNDRGSHNYKNMCTYMKLALNKACERHLVDSAITYKGLSQSKVPLMDVGFRNPRLNVPTKEEYLTFLNYDFHDSCIIRNVASAVMLRDIAVLLVETLSRPIDIIAMRKADIKNGAWSYVPEKFKSRPIEAQRKYMKPIGLTKVAYEIIMKYWRKSKSEYVFPLLDGYDKEADFDGYMQKICVSNQNLNKKLKRMTPLIFKNEVSLYSFRHYAITRAINAGLNIADVSTLAKTSITQINNTYYDRDGVMSMDKLEKLLN